jgi:hypothetical protein
MMNKNKNIDCICSEQTGLFIANRQVALIVASCLTIFFFTFIIGFFAGQRYAIGQFARKLDQESFADHIYSSICSLCDQPEQSADESGCDEEGEEAAEEVASDAAEETVKDSDLAVSGVNGENKEHYFAQLIGFGSEKAAQRLTQRLKDQGLPVLISTHKSRTARGKTITWYQVVTEPFDNKEELSTLVERIVKQERLHNVVIASC